MADRHVDRLLIGGGIAAASCAEALREGGAAGTITIVGREVDLPYHRPPCSKDYLRGIESREDALVHSREFYAQHAIEVLTRVSAMKLDPTARTVRLSTREEIEFGQALIATGANVRRLNVEGAQLEGIHYLRAFGNSDTIREGAAGRRVVVIGGSYLGCEVAAALSELGAQVTIVMLEPVTLSRGFGKTAGRFFQQCLEEHGVSVHGGEELDHFQGDGARIGRVVMKSGLELEADVVVIGVGALPDVMLARAAGLELGESGGIRVDRHLESSVPGIYAAGDVAEYESIVHDGRRLRVEHWDVARSQGRIAAANMLGAEQDYAVVPYFFSDLADWASLEYVGPASDWDQEIVRGSIEDGEFSVWYLRDGKVAAMLSVGRPEDLAVARNLIRSSRRLADPARTLGDLARELTAL